jgi:NADPH-dependent 2,4-dienoyl-CoA reductase/sulfur reductase-like enzyme/CheY-like chemotaxis protein
MTMAEERRVLVAEDERDLLQGLRKSLSKEGYHVDVAEDGLQAVQRIEGENYDILIADLKMPRMDGMELLRRTRQLSPRTVVIIITGYGTLESSVRAMKLGAFDYIPKPFTNDQLVTVVRKAAEAGRGVSVLERALGEGMPGTGADTPGPSDEAGKEEPPVVIIGGSAAGLTAAITARRHYPKRKIVLVRKEEKVLIPCGIPYIFGTVGTPDKNLIPDAALEKNGIDLMLGEVTEIDREEKTLTTKDGQRVEYDKLIIATGSLPIVPPIPGSDKKNVFAVHKSIPVIEEIQERLKSVKDLVVIGGGFIGVEFADECHKAGIPNVTIVEMLPNCLMLAYDQEFCTEAEKILKERGINIITGARVNEITGRDRVSGVKLADEAVLPADAVIIGIGARANVEPAKSAGLSLGPAGGISVDATMKTSDENIYACGDCADKVSFFGGRPSKLKLASVAAAEARIAGANLYGFTRENAGTVGVWATAIGGHAFAGVGLTENMAKNLGYDIAVGSAEAPNRHPGGMAGMAKLKVKLIFDRKSHLLLGAEVMGGECAAEVVNIASACIQGKMTGDDIATFQMATHPALTASPIAYQLVNAAETALVAMRKTEPVLA